MTRSRLNPTLHVLAESVKGQIMQWLVVEEDGYVKVKRENETICAGTTRPGKRVINLEFLDPQNQRNNKTRQKAMNLLQQAGWK